MPNHLSGESSPYLLQHAGNPVDWYPWGAEALEKARREDKPIFLSIGYAACHWCHVMAHESFEDASIAALMNEHFISIKVDREERPDLDSIFMAFVVATTGQGGWPMSVFLTPDGKPFYGGTYFPPVRRYNMPSFYELLKTVIRLWQADRKSLLSSSEDLTRHLLEQQMAHPQPGELVMGSLKQAAHTLAQGYDWQDGGWGTAPKFPQPMTIEFLLRQASRGDQPSLDIALHTLRSMARGGMYDLLGGGFARYSVDSSWLVPHFEKMLYDNAQLASVYLHAYQFTGAESYRETCVATLDFVLRELAHPAGGFFSSLDADSEGEEGKVYLWTPGQIRLALPELSDADLFIATYSVTDGGNFEGKNILRRSLSDEQLATQFQHEAHAIPPKLAVLRKQLLAARTARVQPATDDKVLVAWNALMLAVLAEAGRFLGRPEYLQAAIRNARFMLDGMRIDGRLMRSWREGQAKQPAYLEDYAALGLGLLALYQADPDPRWYQASLSLLDHILSHFQDPAGGFFDTPDDAQALLYRPKDLQDNATPSGNALACLLLLKLAAYEGRSDWRSLAENMISTILGMLLRYPAAFAQWLSALDFALGPVTQVAILGDRADPAMQAMLQSLSRGYYPRTVLAASEVPPPAGSPALLYDRPLLDQKPTAYVCRDFVCRLPVNDAVLMLDQLSGESGQAQANMNE
jgi:uncharacterized protein